MERIIAGSVEFLPVTVTRDGTSHTDFDISVVPTGSAPGTFAPPTTVGTAKGYLVPANIATGPYSIYVRVNGSTPEVPVLKAGSFRVAKY